jgi:hypothetical protein
LEAFDLYSEDLVNGGEAGIVRKGRRRKLNDGQGTQEDQSNIEHEGRHVSLSNDHGMECDAGNSQSKLEATLDSGKQQVHSEDSDAQYAK